MYFLLYSDIFGGFYIYTYKIELKMTKFQVRLFFQVPGQKYF